MPMFPLPKPVPFQPVSPTAAPDKGIKVIPQELVPVKTIPLTQPKPVNEPKN